MRKYIFLALCALLTFSACSTKEVFKPKNITGDWEKYESSDFSVVDTAANIALLDNHEVLTKERVVAVDINATQRVISQSDGWIISASIDGNLTLTSEENSSITKEFILKKTVASATVSGEYLAVVFADNEIALYDTKSKEILFKEQESKYIAADSRIVNPYFMRGLVLYPTLDGKIVFVNTQLKKRLRTVIVSTEDDFNNIISLHILQNKIIAATSYTILSMAKKQIRAKYEIRNIVYDDANIYIATKQGEVLSLTSNLQVNFKIKFPFAHFYGMILDQGKLYILEKEGYMIVVDSATFEYKVYDADFDDGFVFESDKKFYIDDKKLLTE